MNAAGKNKMDIRNFMGSLLLIFGGIFSFYSIAKTPVATIPVNESDYELSHEGVIKVNVNLFSSPCNINIENKKVVMLTGCGAGAAYKTLLKSNDSVEIPAKLRFYDYNERQYLSSYPVLLLNGDNQIKSPYSLLMDDDDSLRLEVSYE